MKQGQVKELSYCMEDTTAVYCDKNLSWEEAALKLREEMLQKMKEKIARLEEQIVQLKKERGKIDSPIGGDYEYYTSLND